MAGPRRQLPYFPSPFSQRIALSFVLAMLLIASGFALSFYSYNRYSTDSKRVEHSYQVISKLEEILSQLKDVETSSRGYAIIKDSLFLEPYRAAMPKIPHNLLALRRLVTDNPAQIRRTDSLVTLVQLKLDITQRQIGVARIDKPAAVQSYFRLGKVRMDNVQRWAKEMMKIEQTMLTERNEQARQSFRNTLLIIFALSMLTFIALILAYRLLESELKQRASNETKLRVYEDELRAQIRQLETSNQELERFAFVASHDLQEPLRKIQSFASLLNDRYGPLLDDNGRQFLGKIMGSAERMSKLIKELLTFSRLNGVKTEFHEVNLNHVMERVLANNELTISALDARITIDELPTIRGIFSQMEQLFDNLIANALKFTFPGEPPVIEIRVERAGNISQLGLAPSKSYFCINITDNGIGFDEKYATHIFDLFQRLHGKTTYEGTGIGLAICKRIVVFHKGAITAYSQPNQGATFTVILPEK